MFGTDVKLEYELPPESFHADLAATAPTLFRDDEFSEIYPDHNGRPSVSPAQLALLLGLQHEAQVSDQVAINSSMCDLRWCMFSESSHSIGCM